MYSLLRLLMQPIACTRYVAWFCPYFGTTDWYSAVGMFLHQE
jgi:hypothetical protein